jgi:hypothetical protein
MGIFSAILDKLRNRGGAQASQGQPTPTDSTGSTTLGSGRSATSAAGPTAQASLQNVDVDAILGQMAAQKGGGGNYRQSIVDLLKLLDLDSSLAARKELAEELNVHAGEHGSAEQNIALHKAVMRKIAENGGKVPASMRD